MVDTVIMYARVTGSRLRTQLGHRLSFALDCLADVLAQATELVAIIVLFSNVPTVGGFDRAEVLLLYAFTGLAFGLADLVVGQVGTLPGLVRTGTFDVVLLRPMSALGQVLTSDLQLRRLGRTVMAVATLVVVLMTVDVQWTAGRVVLVLLAPAAGAVIIASVWVASASVAFWFVDTQEVTGAVTHGTSLFASYPLAVFPGWLRTLMGFVIPSAFVSYYPMLAMLGRADPLGGPAWLAWAGPPVALANAGGCALVWRCAVRRYQGTGS